MNSKLSEALNDQIGLEFASAYQYLAMSGWCALKGLPGCAHWLRIQWQEEVAHALKMVDFMHSRNAALALRHIEEPRHDFGSIQELFTAVLDHECHVTRSINALYDLAISERDYPMQVFLQWFINEQVEEESAVMALIDQLTMAGSDGSALLMVDRQLAVRPLPPSGGPA